MPISRILIILLIAAVFAGGSTGSAVAGAAPAAVPPIEGHLLKVEGKVARLVRIQINGVEVVRGGAQPIPIPVTHVLRDGDNAMALQFASDPTAAWRVSIERRRAGAPPSTLVRYEAGPGETGNNIATRAVQFRVTLPKYPPFDLTDADRRAVIALIVAQHAALSARDAARAEGAYARSVAELTPIYPEGIRLWRSVQVTFDRRLLASPDFKMKPFRAEGLAFTQVGRLLRVSRADGTPLLESEDVVLEQTARGPDGKMGTARVKVAMKPRSMFFARQAGQWYLSVAFGF